MFGCFAAGTPVLMADGTYKPIQDIKPGEWVQSANERTGQVEAKQVTATTSHPASQTVSVTLTDSHTRISQTITCTPNHPFYVDGRGFTPAGSLGIGTSIVTRAGPSLAVSSLQFQAVTAGDTQVYNLTVDGDHTYFVGTVNGGAWVHNANCGMHGNANTRALNGKIKKDLIDDGWTIIRGKRGREEAILDPNWQPTGKPGRPAGTVFPDITAIKDGITMRIQTVDTLANGQMDAREQDNFNKIMARRPGDRLFWFPKNKGW